MELLQRIFNAGVVGAGGAGFPTHIKLDSKVEYLMINGAECEPLLETDKFLMRTKSKEIIHAIEEVGKQVQAKRLVIGLKRKYKVEIEALKEAIKAQASNVELFLMDNFYPAGDEQIMVYEITKRSIPPGGIPLDVGVVVSNVGTMVNIYDAMEEKPVMDKYVTVIGEVKKPSILKVPIGTSVSECIEAVGGAIVRDYKIILGGPMMGSMIDPDRMTEQVITKTVGALIVLPKEHYMVKRKNTSMQHIINQARSACIQCSMCTDMCPRNLIGHKLRPHRIMRCIGMVERNEAILKEALICSECGICELYACPLGLSPRMVNGFVKGILRENGVRYEREQGETTASEMREYRKIPIPRLISRLNLDKYTDQKIAGPFPIVPDSVKIPLNQHIGKAAVPNVAIGDRVQRGQLIGEISVGEFGANIHASIDGKILEISKYIVIQSDNGEVIQ